MISTKEKIMQTALGLFAKRGYDAVSVRDIGAALGLTQAALYKHFKSKRDIFEKIIERMEQEDAQRAGEFEVPVETAEVAGEPYSETTAEKLFAFTKSQFEYWTENEFAADFRRLLTLEQYSSSENAQRFEQYFGSGVTAYTADLLRCMGDLKPWVSGQAEVLAVQLYAPVQFLMGRYDNAQNRSKIKELLNEHLEKMKEMMVK